MEPKLIRETKQMEELKEILPPLGQDDYSRLKESIKDEGIQESIKILPDGTIIDGYHRKRIIQELNIESFPYEVKKISRDEAFELGISLNLARRHLSFDQKKEIIEKLRKRGWAQKRVAKVVGIERSRVSQIEKESIVNINITLLPDLRYKNNWETGGEFPQNVEEQRLLKQGLKLDVASYDIEYLSGCRATFVRTRIETLYRKAS